MSKDPRDRSLIYATEKGGTKSHSIPLSRSKYGFLSDTEFSSFADEQQGILDTKGKYSLNIDPNTVRERYYPSRDAEGVSLGKIDFSGGSSGSSTQSALNDINTYYQEAGILDKLTPEQRRDLLVNNPNIVGPTGSQVYDPRTNTVRLRESEFTESQRGRQEALAAQLSGSLRGELTDTGLEGEAYQRGAELLRPQHEEQREQLEQRLADQGIPIGSEAYTREMDRLEKSQGSQLSNLGLQSIQTSEQVRQQRFNEISSLLGTQQVGGVGFGQFQPQSRGLDILGQHNLEQQLAAQKRAAKSSALGTLGGAAISYFGGRDD